MTYRKKIKLKTAKSLIFIYTLTAILSNTPISLAAAEIEPESEVFENDLHEHELYDNEIQEEELVGEDIYGTEPEEVGADSGSFTENTSDRSDEPDNAVREDEIYELTESLSEEEGATVYFSDDDVSIAGNGAELVSRNGKRCISINSAGVYSFAGEGSDTYVSIETEDKVTLILNDLYMKNKAAFGKAFIEAEKGSDVRLTLTGLTTIKGGEGAVSQKKDSRLSIYGSGSLRIENSADDGIKSKGDITIAEAQIEIWKCLGDGIQGENITINSGCLHIVNRSEHPFAGHYTGGSVSRNNYNTIWKEDGSKYERVNYDTGSHKGIKGGTKAKTIEFRDSDESYSSKASGGVTINGGTIEIDTTRTGLKANKVMDDDYDATDTGVYLIGEPDDGIYSNNTLEIKGGEIYIASADDGISSAGRLAITGHHTYIDIETAYEGIEGKSIVIGTEGAEDGPEISMNTLDDGINASSKSLIYVYDSLSGYKADDGKGYLKKAKSSAGNSLTVYSGLITIKIDSENEKTRVLSDGESDKLLSYYAKGDGIDCNGTFEEEGGEIYSYGQSAGGNTPVDTDRGFTFNRGTIVGTGMDERCHSLPMEGSSFYLTYGEGTRGVPHTEKTENTENSISENYYNAGDTFLIINRENGDIVDSGELPLAGSFILYSSPKLEEGIPYEIAISKNGVSSNRAIHRETVSICNTPYEIRYNECVSFNGGFTELPLLTIGGKKAGEALSGNIVFKRVHYINNREAGEAAFIPVLQAEKGADRKEKAAVRRANDAFRERPFTFRITSSNGLYLY